MKKVVSILLIFIVLITLVILYMRFVGTTGVVVKEYRVSNTQITDSYHGLKMVHLSDIHYGSTVFEKQLEQMIKKVNEIKPDIIVFTGDLFTDKKEYNKDILVAQLSKLEAKLGKYFISGNHDKPLEDYQSIMEQSNFVDLDNTMTLIYNNKEPILLSGISTNYGDSSNIGSKTSELDTYLANLKEDSIKPIYSILLLHEPDFIDKLDLSNYQLILSGHSHGGQIRLPFIGKIYTPYGSEKYYNDYYKIDNTDLYVSSGIGESKFNLRLFNRPSFNFYRITK